MPDEGYRFSEQEDYAGMMELRANLDEALLHHRLSGVQLSANEQAYKVAAAELTLRLRAQGLPVTIIDTLVKGDPYVSDLRFKRDCSKVLHDNAQEEINAIKLSMRIVEAQMNREWQATPTT